ncbi:MAG: lytic transglycosylase domain-containing protein, partial [Bdellovibrionales bacterium]|nr:lytic transglycosylase domain-containing protein [Bdellovibrionales bacterium]
MLKTAVYTFSLLILFIVGGCATPIANEPDISEEQISSFQLKAVKEFDRLEALSDPENRVSREFDISEGLKPRVHFWFNVYTKYGSSDHVIHHSRYPWIVFKVINTEEIEKSSLHKWTKYHRIRKLVAQERKSIRKTLQKLSRRRSYKKLSPLEKQLFDRLKWVRGKRQNVFKFASQHVRSQLGQRDFYVQGLEHSHQFLPFMEEEFQAQNLPKELTRIPFVESSFNVRAESSVGASGIWQIMPRIGSSYGIVGRYIDERNSPYKATSIASKLLRFNYRSLKSWPLAVTAYNNGIGGTRKAVRKTQTSDLAKIIRKHYKGSFKFA